MTLLNGRLVSLDTPTQLDATTASADGGGGWVSVVYPAAGEGVVIWVGKQRRPNGGDRRTASANDAARRARNRLRRYVVANCLSTHLVLTVAGLRPQLSVQQELRRWRRRVRESAGMGPFPYVVVPEIGARGRPHWHTILPTEIARVGGHLWVAGSSRWSVMRSDDERREVAGYVAKHFEGGSQGLHRYEVGQGFQPDRDVYEVEARATGLAVVLRAAATADVTIVEPDVPGPAPLLVRWAVNESWAA